MSAQKVISITCVVANRERELYFCCCCCCVCQYSDFFDFCLQSQYIILFSTYIIVACIFKGVDFQHHILHLPAHRLLHQGWGGVLSLTEVLQHILTHPFGTSEMLLTRLHQLGRTKILNQGFVVTVRISSRNSSFVTILGES